MIPIWVYICLGQSCRKEASMANQEDIALMGHLLRRAGFGARPGGD